MGELRILIPNDLHKQLKRMALDDGNSLKELVISILKDHAGRGSGQHDFAAQQPGR